MSLPSVSIVTDVDSLFDSSVGIYPNSNHEEDGWTRHASLEIIYPDGSETFQGNCGLRIYGGASRSPDFFKHSLRVLFKSIYGPSKLKYDLFGGDAVDEFDTIIFRAGFNNSIAANEERGQLLRDEWCRETQAAMGQPVLHGRFMHLYINGLYWGLYNPVERCNSDFGSQYFGGEKEDYDALNSGEVKDGDRQAWDYAREIARDIYEYNNVTQDNYDALAECIDIPNLIDYMLMNFYGGNEDWDGHNWYSLRKREAGSKWRFFAWELRSHPRSRLQRC